MPWRIDALYIDASYTLPQTRPPPSDDNLIQATTMACKTASTTFHTQAKGIDLFRPTKKDSTTDTVGAQICTPELLNAIRSRLR